MSAAEIGARTFTAEFALAETVYLRVATERRPGFVVAVTFTPGGAFYRVGWGDATETSHYAIELTREYEPDFAA